MRRVATALAVGVGRAVASAWAVRGIKLRHRVGGSSGVSSVAQAPDAAAGSRVAQVAQLGCGGGGLGGTGGSGGDGGGGGRGGGGRGGTERKFRDGRANGRQGDGWEVVSGRRRVRRTGGGDQSPTKGLREEQALFSGQPLSTLV